MYIRLLQEDEECSTIWLIIRRSQVNRRVL